MNSTQPTPSTPASIRERAYQYHVKGLTCAEIAKLLDLSPRTVERYSLAEKWRERANPQPLAERAKALQKQGFSYAQIARTLAVGKSTVYGYLRSAKQRTGNPVGSENGVSNGAKK